MATKVYDDINNKIEEQADKLKKYQTDYKKHVDSFDEIEKKYGKKVAKFYEEEFEKNWKSTVLERREGVLQDKQGVLQKKEQDDQKQLENMQQKLQHLQQKEQNNDDNPLLSSVYIEYCLKILKKTLELEQKLQQDELKKEQSALQKEGQEFKEQQDKQQVENRQKQDLEQDAIVDYKNTKGDYEQEMDRIVDEELIDLNTKYRQMVGLYETYLKQMEYCSVEDNEKMLKDFKQDVDKLMIGEEVIAKKYSIENEEQDLEEIPLSVENSQNEVNQNTENGMQINFGNSGINNLNLKNLKSHNKAIQR